MSADTILYILLASSVVGWLISARMTAEAQRAFKATFGTGVLLAIGFVSLVNTGLYVWFAVASGYWQFAVMSIGSLVVTRVIGAAVSGERP